METEQKLLNLKKCSGSLDEASRQIFIAKLVEDVPAASRSKLYHQVLDGLLPTEQLEILKTSVMEFDLEAQLDLITSLMTNFDQIDKENLIQVLTLELNDEQYKQISIQVNCN